MLKPEGKKHGVSEGVRMLLCKIEILRLIGLNPREKENANTSQDFCSSRTTTKTKNNNVIEDAVSKW